jgi:hypothetical protein
VTTIMDDAGLFFARPTGTDAWEIVTPLGMPNREVIYLATWEGESFRFVLDPFRPDIATGHGTLMDAMQHVIEGS